MGANLIGYQTMIPDKFTAKEKKVLEKHLDDLENLLKSKDFVKNLAKETSANDPLLTQINRLSPLLASDMNDRCSYDEESYEELGELIDEVIGIIPEARSFVEYTNFGGKDCSSRLYTILGRQFHSIFAGDMSWGDEPEGEGYTQLRDMDRVGLLSKIEELTIPSKSLSIEFIKGD